MVSSSRCQPDLLKDDKINGQILRKNKTPVKMLSVTPKIFTIFKGTNGHVSLEKPGNNDKLCNFCFTQLDWKRLGNSQAVWQREVFDVPCFGVEGTALFFLNWCGVLKLSCRPLFGQAQHLTNLRRTKPPSAQRGESWMPGSSKTRPCFPLKGWHSS